MQVDILHTRVLFRVVYAGGLPLRADVAFTTHADPPTAPHRLPYRARHTACLRLAFPTYTTALHQTRTTPHYPTTAFFHPYVRYCRFLSVVHYAAYTFPTARILPPLLHSAPETFAAVASFFLLFSPTTAARLAEHGHSAIAPPTALRVTYSG